MANPLNQRRYAINIVVADIGWITPGEEDDIAALLEGGVVQFAPALQELHLYWPVLADTMGDALNGACTTLRRAIDATGVTVPHTRRVHVDEIGQ